MAIAPAVPPTDRAVARPAPTARRVTATERRHMVVPVTDHLDDCTASLDAAQARRARLECVAACLRFEPGPWTPPSDQSRYGSWLGLLVVDGLVTRAVDLGRNRAQELLGPGDVLRPWDDDGGSASVPWVSSWRVIAPASIAVLDDRFAIRAARWPHVGVGLVRAAVRRSHAKSHLLALTRARRADDRLLLLFWHLADRWGRVGVDGVHVPLRLTHALLAELVCLRRPTVSATLSLLQAQGRLLRLADGTWQLPSREPVPAQCSGIDEATPDRVPCQRDAVA